MDRISHEKKGLTYMMSFTVLLLSYMAIICYFGVFYLKIFGFYGFWKKQTIGVTLLNSALYASKMTFPMTFNFMLMFFKSYSDKTDFVRVTPIPKKYKFSNSNLGYRRPKSSPCPWIQSPTIHPAYPSSHRSIQFLQPLWQDP